MLVFALMSKKKKKKQSKLIIVSVFYISFHKLNIDMI